MAMLLGLDGGTALARTAGSTAAGDATSAASTEHATPPPVDPGGSMSQPLPGSGQVGAPAATNPGVMGPGVEAEYYGPPAPKAVHGRLAQIDWPRAPALVPRALEEAINLVTRTYPTVGAARAALRAAATDLRATRLQRFPSFSGNLNLYNTDRNPIPQMVIEAPVWDGGRIGANTRRARASEDSSSAGYVDTIHTLALTTVQTYFDIVRLTEREQLLTSSLGEHQRLVRTMERRVSQEVSPLVDLELARSRTAQVAQDLNTTHAQRLTSLRILAQLISEPNYDVGPIPYFDPTIDLPGQDVLEDQAAAYSPQLRRLQAEVDVSRADFDARKAALLPQVLAQYSYDQFYGHRVGGVIRAQNDITQIPQVESARSRIAVAEDNRRASEEQLRREVASDLIEFQSARSRATISHDAAVTAVRVSESFMRQFIAGRRSWLDVMNELREAVTAQISESEAEVSVMSTATRLLIESGRWRPKFDVTAP